jgi:transposase InsO family protein
VIVATLRSGASPDTAPASRNVRGSRRDGLAELRRVSLGVLLVPHLASEEEMLEHKMPVARDARRTRLGRGADHAPDAPNEAWVTDITYVPTAEGGCIWQLSSTCIRAAWSAGR